MAILFENSLYCFTLLNDSRPILFFEWTEKTFEMSYDDFQESCHNYAGFAWQYKARHLLVDTRHFRFQLPEQFHYWREKELNPRYYELGVQKFAYIAKPELIASMKDIPAAEGKFETRNFVSKQDAFNWLNE